MPNDDLHRVAHLVGLSLEDLPHCQEVGGDRAVSGSISLMHSLGRFGAFTFDAKPDHVDREAISKSCVKAHYSLHHPERWMSFRAVDDVKVERLSELPTLYPKNISATMLQNL